MLPKIAIVTGASRGIGKAIAIRLSELGYQVIVNYARHEMAALEVVAEIESKNGKAVKCKADVSCADEAQMLIDFTLDRFGQIDVLVNNAGITRDNLLSMMDVSDLEAVIQANLLGPIYCTQAASRPMMRRRQGCIVNISSASATRPGKGQSNYAASKGGLESFTKAMAVELAPRNIRVNAVAPGVIATDMSSQVRELGEVEIFNRLLTKRYGRPDEIAGAVAYLASDEAAYITGEIMHINGGLKMA